MEAPAGAIVVGGVRASKRPPLHQRSGRTRLMADQDG